MGMSTCVVGVRDLDGAFAKMLSAKLACEAAGVGYPPEVDAYFTVDGCVSSGEDESYLREQMETIDIDGAVSKCGGEMQDGFQVDLSKLPNGVKSVRFVNSW